MLENRLSQADIEPLADGRRGDGDVGTEPQPSVSMAGNDSADANWPSGLANTL